MLLFLNRAAWKHFWKVREVFIVPRHWHSPASLSNLHLNEARADIVFNSPPIAGKITPRSQWEIQATSSITATEAAETWDSGKLGFWCATIICSMWFYLWPVHVSLAWGRKRHGGKGGKEKGLREQRSNRQDGNPRTQKGTSLNQRNIRLILISLQIIHKPSKKQSVRVMQTCCETEQNLRGGW